MGKYTEFDVIEANFELEELKNNLSNTDYIACKIAEGSATKEEYAELIQARQEWRDRINQLEEVIRNADTKNS